MQTGSWKQCALLVLFATALFSANIGGYDVWAPDEPRFAEAAREMFVSGDFLVPRVNGETYLEKPPLLFWAMAAVSAPFGEVSATTARIPSVLAGVVTVLLTYLIALRLFSRATAFWAAIVLMCCVRIWWSARTGQIDMLLTACTTTGLYAFCRFETDRRARWMLLLYAALTAGMLAKGPPALVCPLLFLFFHYRTDKEARKATYWPWGLAAVVLLTALWFVPARMAGAENAAEAVSSGIGENLFRNTIGRMFLGVSKAQWPWYYLTTVPVDLLPWALFLPWTLPWVWKNRKTHPGVRFLWRWCVPAFIFFSICIGKRSIYLLPLFPAFAILLAASIEDFFAASRQRWRKRVGLVWATALVVAGLAPAALPWTEYADVWGTGIGVAMAMLLGAGVVVAVASLRDEGRQLRKGFAVSTAVLFMATAFFILPAVNPHKGASDFCAPVRGLAQDGVDFRLYSVGFSREEYIFYAKHFHEEVFTSLEGFEDIDPRQVLRARKRIEDAVEEVPVADLSHPAPEEIAALRQAMEDAIAGADGEEQESLAKYEVDLEREVHDFAQEFSEGGPAFMFVREEDWRWLIPLYDRDDYHVVRHQRVGSRIVLLVANSPGAGLVETPEEI